MVLSTVTETGRQAAAQIEGAEAIFYLPFDFPFAVRRALERVQPSAIAVVETELWPNLIREAAGRGIPVAVANGRLSERSLRRYSWLRPLFTPAVKRLAGVAARGEADAARFRALGAKRVFVAGNVKYDAPAPAAQEDPAGFRARYGFAGSGVVIVAGSTHPGEEAAVGKAVRALRERHPGLGLLLAPRHLERLGEAEEALRGVGLAPVRWSGLPEAGDAGSAPGRVVLLDVMGKLAEAYACATVAFIGGSLIPHGGQNPIEAARWGVPVVFGPFMENFAEVAEALLGAGGALQVEGPYALEWAFERWLSDEEARGRAGGAARAAVLASRGAADRAAAFLVEVLDLAGGRRA